jgi:hypothetical protein
MRERKKSLERLVAVKTQLRQIEEARLTELEKRGAEARRDRDAMIGLLDRIEANDGLLLRLAYKRVAAAERGAATLDAQAIEQRRVLLQRGAQTRSAENLLKAAAAALAREEEKRALLDIAERLAGAHPTSLP